MSINELMTWGILRIVLDVIAVLLNLVGLLLLFKRYSFSLKRYGSEISLSCVSMVICLLNIPGTYWTIHRVFAQETFVKVAHYWHALFIGLCYPFYVTMFLLTQDRFYAVFLHILYRDSWFYRWKNRICIISWLIGASNFIITIIITCEISTERARRMKYFERYFLATISLLLVFQFIVEYSYIFYVVIKMKSRHRKNKDYKLIAPALVVLSYIIFVALGDIVIIFFQYKPSKTYNRFLMVSNEFNFICDAFVYLFFRSKSKSRRYSSSNSATSSQILRSLRME